MDMQVFRDLVTARQSSPQAEELVRIGAKGPTPPPPERDPSTGGSAGSPETSGQDPLPESTQYRDEGCDISPSCLRCPLPRCRYDDPGWLRREAKARRDQEVLRMQGAEGLGPMELAARFGVSRRTIHRILHEYGGFGDEG